MDFSIRGSRSLSLGPRTPIRPHKRTAATVENWIPVAPSLPSSRPPVDGQNNSVRMKIHVLRRSFPTTHDSRSRVLESPWNPNALVKPSNKWVSASTKEKIPSIYRYHRPPDFPYSSQIRANCWRDKRPNGNKLVRRWYYIRMLLLLKKAFPCDK